MSNPAIEVVKAISRCIANEWKILEVHKTFKVIEHQNGQELHVSVASMSDVVCIDIDKKKVKPASGRAMDPTLPFFEQSESGILKKNDAIFFCSSDGRLLVFLVELKQKNNNDYLLQLKSGMAFVSYVLNVLDLHEKCDSVEPAFFGVICYGEAEGQQRRGASKQPFNRSSSYSFSDRNGVMTSSCYDSKVVLQEWINAAKRTL